MNKKKNENYCGIPLKAQINSALTENEKYLFGVIAFNATEQGYWLIHRDFLTDLFNIDPAALSHWIYNLQKEGFVICRNEMHNQCKHLSFKILFPLP
jgi:hypothetical protein